MSGGHCIADEVRYWKICLLVIVQDLLVDTVVMGPTTTTRLLQTTKEAKVLDPLNSQGGIISQGHLVSVHTLWYTLGVATRLHQYFLGIRS